MHVRQRKKLNYQEKYTNNTLCQFETNFNSGDINIANLHAIFQNNPRNSD